MKLGDIMQLTIFCARQSVTYDQEQLMAVQDEIIKAIEMEKGGAEAAVWVFPVDNMGGTGRTIIQPIVTSFMGFFVGTDTWTDNDHLWFFIASCKPYNPQKALHIIKGQLTENVTMWTPALMHKDDGNPLKEEVKG